MKATLSAVRAYGTHSRYSPEDDRTTFGSPVIVPSFPSDGWTTTLSFGDPVAWVLDAEGLTQAARRTLFTGEFGRAQTGDIEALKHVDELRRTVGPTGEEWPWWTTIACERDHEVADDEWLKMPFMWVSPVVAEALADEARTETARATDALAALIGATIPNAMTGPPAIERVFLRATDRQAFGLLTLTLPAPTIHVSSPTDVDLSDLAGKIRRLHPELRRLESALYWWARSIEESDPRRRFQFQFLCLEVLTEKLAQGAREAVVPTLRAGPPEASVPVPPHLVGEQRTFLSKFAFVALRLSPATAVEDVGIVAGLKRTRDLVAHGASPLDANPPIDDAAQLISRYLGLLLGPNPARDGVE